MTKRKPPATTKAKTADHGGGESGISSEDLTSLFSSSPIESLSLASLGTYMFFDEVDAETVRPVCEFIIKANFIFDEKMKLTLIMNTPGGNAYDGFALVDTMDTSRLPISTLAIGHVCSMGTVIFTAGTPGHRVMTRNSYMMMHQYSDFMEGKYHEFVAHRPHQDDLQDRFIKHFLTRTKMKEKQVRSLLLGKNDEWITAKDALRMGLCDRVQNPWE